MITSEDDWHERLVAAAERIRASRTLDKSSYLNRLFDFLVARTLAGEPPKELEIAHEVYNIPLTAESGQDTTVRVSVHRLRKKLEDFPVDGLTERLLLPRGGYRLVLEPIKREGTPPAPASENAVAPQERRWLGWPQLMWGLVGAVAATALCLGLFAALRPVSVAPTDPRTASALWSPLNRTTLPTLLVVGDHYVLGMTDQRGKMSRLVQIPEVPSPQALDTYKRTVGSPTEKLVDLNYYEIPAAAAGALADILPLAAMAVEGGSAKLTTIANSRFANDQLSDNNIIYLGLLSGLRDLRDPIFEGSGFTLSAIGDALVDRASGRIFQSNWSDLSDNRVLARDYAYLARLTGPSGNQMIVIAGTRDPAFAEAAQIASNPAKLAALSSRVGKVAAFEALYEVRTFGPSNYASRLVLVRPMRPQRGW